MKLLFDENLSPSLVQNLADVYPDARHVEDCGLGSVDDGRIWEFARQDARAIVTKDADFYNRAVLYGSPPKVIWLRIGNCRTADIATLLRRHSTRLDAFERSDEVALVLTRSSHSH